MTLFWGLAWPLAVTAVVAFFFWRIWRRSNQWAAGMRDLGFAFAHVRVLPAGDTSQAFDVTLHDSTRPHEIQRISIDLVDLDATGLETPEGFVRSEALEHEIADISLRPRMWVPVRSQALAPGETRRFTLHFAPSAIAPGAVTITLAVPVTVGGGVMPVNLPVPLRDPRAVANWNERADLRLRARRLGVMPNTLPAWADMRAREEALRAETGHMI